MRMGPRSLEPAPGYLKKQEIWYEAVRNNPYTLQYTLQYLAKSCQFRLVSLRSYIVTLIPTLTKFYIHTYIPDLLKT